jgi:hypothetical protein
MTTLTKRILNTKHYMVCDLLVSLLCVCVGLYFEYYFVFVLGLLCLCFIGVGGYLQRKSERCSVLDRRDEISQRKTFLIHGYYRGKKILQVADLKKGKYYIVDRYGYELLLHVEEDAKDWYGKFVTSPQALPYWVMGYFLDVLVTDTKVSQVYGAVKKQIR